MGCTGWCMIPPGSLDSGPSPGEDFAISVHTTGYGQNPPRYQESYAYGEITITGSYSGPIHYQIEVTHTGSSHVTASLDGEQSIKAIMHSESWRIDQPVRISVTAIDARGQSATTIWYPGRQS